MSDGITDAGRGYDYYMWRKKMPEGMTHDELVAALMMQANDLTEMTRAQHQADALEAAMDSLFGPLVNEPHENALRSSARVAYAKKWGEG